MSEIVSKPVTLGSLTTVLFVLLFSQTGLALPYIITLGTSLGGLVTGLSTHEYGQTPKNGALFVVTVSVAFAAIAIGYVLIQPSAYAVDSDSFKLGLKTVLSTILSVPIFCLSGWVSTMAGHKLKTTGKTPRA